MTLNYNKVHGPRKESLGSSSNLALPSSDIFPHARTNIKSASERLFNQLLPNLKQSYPERLQRLNSYATTLKLLTDRKIDPGLGGNVLGSQIDLLGLSSDIPVLIVGDLHGEIYNLRRILFDRNNLDRIARGEAVLLLLGDLVHPEHGDLGQMGSSIQLHEFYMNLKTRYPHHVFSLVGNHDPIYEWTFKKKAIEGSEPVLQSSLYREHLYRILIEGGANPFESVEYLNKYAQQTELLAFFAIGQRFTALHAGPIKNLSLEQIRKQMPIDDVTGFEQMRIPQANIYHTMMSLERQVAYNCGCWSRYSEQSLSPDENNDFFYTWDDVRSFMNICDQNEGVLFVGHSPPSNMNEWHQEIFAKEDEQEELNKIRHFSLTASRRAALGYAVMQAGSLDLRTI